MSFMHCFLKLNLPRKTANYRKLITRLKVYNVIKTGPKLWIENQFLVNHFKHEYNKLSQKTCSVILFSKYLFGLPKVTNHSSNN